MDMKKYLWGIIFLVMIISIPFLWERVQVEAENDTYEITIPYEDIEAIIGTGIEVEEVYQKLTEENRLQSVSFEPLTVRDLRERDLLNYLSKINLMSNFDVDRGDLPEEPGIFLQIFDEEHPLLANLEEVLNETREEYGIEVQPTTIEDKPFLFVPYGSSRILSEPVTFDMLAYEQVVEQGLSVVPRLENNFPFMNEDHLFFRQLEVMSENADRILFIGEEVVGFADPHQVKLMANRMNDLNLSVILIENSNQDGMHQLVNHLERDVVRLHSMTLGKEHKATDYTPVFRGTRAIHERNIQVLFVNILSKGSPTEAYNHPGEALTSLETSSQFFEAIQRRTNGEIGQAKPFNPLTQPLWFQLSVLLAAGAFTGLAAGKIDKRLLLPIVIASAVFFLLVALSNIDLLLKLVVLGLAILAPVFAIFSIQTPIGWKGFACQYAKAIGIALVGAWFVVSLLYGSDYFVHLDSFRGVKVLALAPLVIVAVLMVGYQWLDNIVKYWHLLILAIVAGVIFFYLTRTGNQGFALPFELFFRQWLENTLGVRPRTTEFLIGFPLLTFGIYLMKDGFKLAKYFLLFGAFAFSSMVGTFTHLHTPLLISIQRTTIGLAIGIGLGLILIAIYHLAKTQLYPIMKERLQK